MPILAKAARYAAEGVAAAMMAAIFCTFILQIIVRYAVGSEWFVALTGNAIDSATFGWTFEFILVMWLWTIFWGNAFIVRARDHVTFDIFYDVAGLRARTVMTLIGAAVIVAALWASIGPTYDRMRILALKSSATLPVKMLPIYSIYFLFLAAVGLRYLWRAIDVARHGADKGLHVPPYEAAIREAGRK